MAVGRLAAYMADRACPEDLSGHFAVWAASPAACGLPGRWVGATGAGAELTAPPADKLENQGYLRLGLQGFEPGDQRDFMKRVFKAPPQPAAGMA